MSGALVRRLAAQRRATARARRTFLTATVLFGAAALWLVGRAGLGSDAVLVAAAVVALVGVSGLVVLQRRAQRRLAHLNDPGPPLVSLATLGERFASHRRFQRVLYWALLAPFSVGLLVVPILIPRMPATWLAGERLFVVWFVAFLVGLVIAGYVDAARRTALGLSCPQCGAALVSLQGLRLDGESCPDCGVAIATGLQDVMRLPVRSGGLPPPTSAAEFRERNEQLESDSGRDYVVFIGGSVVIFIGALFLLLSRAGSERSPAARFVPALVGMVLAMGVAMLGGQRWVWRAQRLGLACPACKELLAGTSAGQTQARGACPACGTVLWKAADGA